MLGCYLLGDLGEIGGLRTDAAKLPVLYTKGAYLVPVAADDMMSSVPCCFPCCATPCVAAVAQHFSLRSVAPWWINAQVQRVANTQWFPGPSQAALVCPDRRTKLGWHTAKHPHVSCALLTSTNKGYITHNASLSFVTTVVVIAAIRGPIPRRYVQESSKKLLLSCPSRIACAHAKHYKRVLGPYPELTVFECAWLDCLKSWVCCAATSQPCIEKFESRCS